MFRQFCFIFAVAAAGAVLAYAQEAPVTVRVSNVSPDSGKRMYVNYCAPCHGLDGRGHGPTAAALKVPPSDLTTIAKAHNGTYPTARLEAALEFGVDSPAHGSKEMPVWGPVFQQMDHATNVPLESLRIRNIVRYLETLQVK